LIEKVPKGSEMKPRKIIDYGTHCVSIEDESMDRHLKLRLGKSTSKGSFGAILSTLDARKLAYALLLEADT
jgi:hypothetical protein